MTLSAILKGLQGLFFKKNCLVRRLKKEASYKLRMTLTAILIGLQGLFFKKILLRQLKKEATYKLIFKIFAVGQLQRFQKE